MLKIISSASSRHLITKHFSWFRGYESGCLPMFPTKNQNKFFKRSPILSLYYIYEKVTEQINISYCISEAVLMFILITPGVLKRILKLINPVWMRVVVIKYWNTELRIPLEAGVLITSQNQLYAFWALRPFSAQVWWNPLSFVSCATTGWRLRSSSGATVTGENRRCQWEYLSLQ